ncbi:c-type cytochrome [Dechloromonas denitrificans]|uniref:c-type cytochrome n=1 Tax=Dechloromonas denitrificans TaxID=281362 RepID=UPI001CF8B847|nr:c-type cytochrome [Dechloromonas denitrificans]UCV01986.1 c-type cytochrome [Dechloromonas denitrificans]UCV06319.1 c-type cytochrome [Dechloromonas denitrificans]
MFRFSSASLGLGGTKTILVLALAAASTAGLAFDNYSGVGRPATPAEVKAWDIDVRPDFKGLPKGSGSVDRGQELFEEKCASCHGSFGESNEVFTPLVGGTSKDDMKTGRVKGLSSGELPQRTTFTKVATISTVFDYIQRAMPWTSPKSLKPDEVYAILAYLLNLSEMVPADFVLSDKNIADVQKLLPNRNGMTTDHGLWPGAAAKKGGIGNGGKPDTKNVACMKNCKSEVLIGSTLPEYARTAHGELADQNRNFGPVRGTRTLGPEAAKKAADAGTLELATKSGCMACHGLKNKIVGPGYSEVVARYKDQADAEERLVAKVKAGGQGVWGSIPMPPNGHLPDEDLKTLVKWILSGAK